jgi:hypothetical protein
MAAQVEVKDLIIQACQQPEQFDRIRRIVDSPIRRPLRARDVRNQRRMTPPPKRVMNRRQIRLNATVGRRERPKLKYAQLTGWKGS